MNSTGVQELGWAASGWAEGGTEGEGILDDPWLLTGKSAQGARKKGFPLENTSKA